MATQSQSTSTQSAAKETPSGFGEYARRASDTAVSAVDLQFGAALTAADRVRELVKPWRQRETAQQEIKHMRRRFTREVNKVERRGGTARRKTTQRAKRTRNRVEREVKQRRRTAEQRIKTARTQVGDRVSELV